MNEYARGDKVRVINGKSHFDTQVGIVIDVKVDRATRRVRVQIRFPKEKIMGVQMQTEPWFASWEVDIVDEDLVA